jgi:drug/metabolite transporter (DMT)-like permease
MVRPADGAPRRVDAALIAVLLACVSALLFGAMSVGLRIGLGRHPGVELATVSTVLGALVVALVAAVAEAPARGVHAGGAWPFLLAGLLQPGIGQLLVTLAIREAGASRASVVFGVAPLISVTIALLFLGEPVSVPLIAGAVLIVAGGVELARERGRPEHLRAIGLLYAFAVTVLFSVRDNVLRWLSRGTDVPPAVAAAAAVLGGTAVILAVLGPRLRGRVQLHDALPFLGVGVLFGLSYVSLFEAFYRGRVTVVSPLVATESLWGVGLSVLLIRHTELVGRRLAIGAVLVVAGGALIGVFR